MRPDKTTAMRVTTCLLCLQARPGAAFQFGRAPLKLAAAAPAGDRDRKPSAPPMFIVPNIDQSDDRRRGLPGPDGFTDRELESYPYALAPSVDNTLEILAMARAEFQDWTRRTVDRNVNGMRYTFDHQQWTNGYRKWWARLLEADEQARSDFARLYARVEEMDRAARAGSAWDTDGGKGAQISAASAVEEEWGNIYLDCVMEEEAPAAPVERFVATAEAEEFGDQEMIDCAMRGRWRYKFDENAGDAEVDFSPRQ